jgi:hypothetical protein
MTMGLEGRLKARREAPLHVQLQLTSVPPECPNHEVAIEGRIVTVFRGQALAAAGAVVEFPIWVCRPGDEPTGPAYVYHDTLVAATYMELYLYGSPPKCQLAAYEFVVIASSSATPVLSAEDLQQVESPSIRREQAVLKKWWHLW